MNDHAENGHVDPILRELALGLVPEDEAEAAWAHLAECTDCAESLRAARSLYESGLDEGRGHVAAEKMVAHSERTVPLSRTEQVHIERCSDCQADLELLNTAPGIDQISFEEEAWAKTTGAAKDDGREPPRESRTSRRPLAERPTAARRWLRGWTLGGALTLATAAVAFFTLVPRSRVDTTGLVRVVPIEVRIPRSAPEPETFEEAWIEALGAYADARYETAESGLRGALSLDPQHAESWLLLGSSQLLLGREDDAIAAFRSAEHFSPNAAVSAEAEWQQVVAQLAAGSMKAAEVEELRGQIAGIASGSGKHAGDAQELLARLGAR